MKSKKNQPIAQIRHDLGFLSSYEVVLHGSYIRNDFIANRSDIDVAVITRIRDKSENITLWNSFLGIAPPIYDIRIYDLLPLYIQIEIIHDYHVLFGNELDISEYFYEYRKIWNDMEQRIKENQFENIADKEQGLQRWKEFISKQMT